jgi:hypothetical protein
VTTLIAMTPNRAMPRTMSIAAMRSEGAIGPALEVASSWSWALPDCNVAISFLAPMHGLCAAQYTTSRNSPPSAVCAFRWQTVTVDSAAHWHIVTVRDPSALEPSRRGPARAQPHHSRTWCTSMMLPSGS